MIQISYLNAGLLLLLLVGCILVTISPAKPEDARCQQLVQLAAVQHLFTPDQVAQGRAWYARHCSLRSGVKVKRRARK